MEYLFQMLISNAQWKRNQCRKDVVFRTRKQREKIYRDRLSNETASRIKRGDEKGNEETDGECNRTG